MNAIILFLAFLTLVLIGMPMVVALAATAGIAFLMTQGMPATTLVQSAIFGVNSYVLLAVPLFILTGELMNASGIASRLFNLASALVGHLRGGLAQVTVLAGVFMAGISGSAAADAALSTKIILPPMIKRGYGPGFSGAVIASSAILAPVIPPSISLILYGSIVNVSIGKLFIAAIIPGLMMAAALTGVVALISIRRNFRGEDQRASFREVTRRFVEAGWALLLPGIIVVGLRFGYFTPTEAGAVAATYAAFVGLVVYRTIRLSDLPKILVNAAIDTGMVMLIVAAAASFTFYLTIMQVPQMIAREIALYGNSQLLFMILTNLALLFAGMLMEATALLLLTAPILAPIAIRLGIDPVHFGIVMVINIMIGTLTPPFGQVAFIVSAISRIPVERIFAQVLFFLPALILILAIISFVPLYFPSFLF
jgi:tripartite ATP-independent transporter DctM subunit